MTSDVPEEVVGSGLEFKAFYFRSYALSIKQCGYVRVRAHMRTHAKKYIYLNRELN